MSTKTDGENMSADTENRDMSADTENRHMSADTENRNMSADTENRDMSADTENRHMSADTENRNMSPHTTPGTSYVDTETDHLFRETESDDASRETTIDIPSLDADSTDTPDTLTLARLDRENQGTWEAEYIYGGEADLHRHYVGCTKNPGHENFIPVDKFSIEDLPEEYRDEDVMDYIRAVSDLTVRVTVKYVSDKRPETDVVSGKLFPGYSYRGRRRTTVGTGWVYTVNVYHGDGENTCRCQDCLTSSKPVTEFGRISILTACHVVYDESEAAHTTCHLFFDRGSTPQACKGVVTLVAMSGDWGYRDSDQYYTSHYTHDLNLAHRLDQRCKQGGDLLTKIWKKSPYTWNLKWSRPAPDKQPLLFIVSHPHGCSKQISIGRCHSILRLRNYWELGSYTYTTATCPGSSGAVIHVLNEAVHPLKIHNLRRPPLHRGVCDKQPRMNESLFYEGWPFSEMVSQNLLWGDRGGLRSEDICSAEEEDLRKHYDTCQHNPGHQNFFPADKFSEDHLPPCECKDEIMELIKVLSDLTVRVSVRYKGSNQLSIESGFIINAGISAEPMPGDIQILTVSHLVNPNLEGEETTCHLFFDSGETPDACEGAVALTKEQRMAIYFSDDGCRLVYNIHDRVLAQKLYESQRRYGILQWKCYRSYQREIVKQSERKNLTPNPPLFIVVSHPHGLAKHVSINYPGCHGNTDTEEIQSPYKSITCPGSSGAPVITLGPQTVYPCLEFHPSYLKRTSTFPAPVPGT